MITAEQRLDLLEVESKLENISANSILLKGKVRKAIDEDDLAKDQLKEINTINTLLSDYVIDTAELLNQCLRIEEKEENDTEIPV